MTKTRNIASCTRVLHKADGSKMDRPFLSRRKQDVRGRHGSTEITLFPCCIPSGRGNAQGTARSVSAGAGEAVLFTPG